MTPSKHIRDQLDALGAQADFTAGSRVLVADEGGTRVTCELTALGTLGCTFGHLTVENPSLADATVEEVQDIGTHLAKKLTYLLEPIAPIEFDAAGCVVQLRSQPPHHVADSRSYYELLVRRGGSICLRRFTKNNGATREQTPASVTREVLERLIDDLVAALG